MLIIDELQIKDFTDSHFTQSLVAFQLPENTQVKNFNNDKSVVLDTQGSFKSFGLNASVTLSEKKTVLILFNVNIHSDDQPFAVRVRMGNIFNRKSVLSSRYLKYGRAFGYVVRVLEKGTYTFEIDFRSGSKATFNPDTTNTQNVSMQIVEMD